MKNKHMGFCKENNELLKIFISSGNFIRKLTSAYSVIKVVHLFNQ